MNKWIYNLLYFILFFILLNFVGFGIKIILSLPPFLSLALAILFVINLKKIINFIQALIDKILKRFKN